MNFHFNDRLAVYFAPLNEFLIIEQTEKSSFQIKQRQHFYFKQILFKFHPNITY